MDTLCQAPTFAVMMIVVFVLCTSGPTLQQIVYRKVYPNSEEALSKLFSVVFYHLQLPFTDVFSDEEIE